MAVLHDIRCDACERTESNVAISNGIFPDCCGQPMRWVPFVPKTDVMGGPTWSWACGDYVTSSRERDARMKRAGFEPSGDKVNGARDEGHLNLGKTTSFPGQSVRRTLTRER